MLMDPTDPDPEKSKEHCATFYVCVLAQSQQLYKGASRHPLVRLRWRPQVL
jgi:hypothetical protein